MNRSSVNASIVRIQDADSFWLPLGELKRWERNPRKNDPAVPRVAASIERFGFVSPIVVWRAADRMVAGDTRLKAMRALLKRDSSFAAKGAPGPVLVRVVFHDFASEAEAVLYAIADNKLGELSAWDDEAVGAILAEHSAADAALVGFDVEQKEQAKELAVEEVDVSTLVNASFTLIIRGPIVAQSNVLERVRTSLADIEGLVIEAMAG